MLSAGPMPCPISRYQLPFADAKSIPACFHKRGSACVPEWSPREMNGAFAAAIFRISSRRRSTSSLTTFLHFLGDLGQTRRGGRSVDAIPQRLAAKADELFKLRDEIAQLSRDHLCPSLSAASLD
jgi:hypothetical protein